MLLTNDMGGGLPSGIICMWSGTASNIPDGWVLCNGANGTPNLTNRFIVGAGSTYSPGNTGGSNTMTLSTNNMPAHTHSVSITGSTETASASASVTLYGSGIDGHSYFCGTGKFLNNSSSASLSMTHSHNISVTGTAGSTGSGQAFNNMPLYYALCYIMKI